MLFACSGIPLPNKICGNSKLHLTRFVTSARLVEEFNRNRNKDDQLRVRSTYHRVHFSLFIQANCGHSMLIYCQVEVCLPDRTTVFGLLGLYDADIAIVTSLGLLAIQPVDLDTEATVVGPDDSVLAAGRAFNSGSLMTMDVSGIISHEVGPARLILLSLSTPCSSLTSPLKSSMVASNAGVGRLRRVVGSECIFYPAASDLAEGMNLVKWIKQCLLAIATTPLASI